MLLYGIRLNGSAVSRLGNTQVQEADLEEVDTSIRWPLSSCIVALKLSAVDLLYCAIPI